MGLLGEGISEVIATTRCNAAPMGIIRRGGSYSMVIYRGSHTAENVERDGWIVANLVFDPVMYVSTAFGDLPPGAFVEEEAGGIRMQRLREAEAWIAFRAEVERSSPAALGIRLTLLREEVLCAKVRPVNRGFNSVIEATVHATRYRLTQDEELLRLIRHHLAIVRRCGGPGEQEAIRRLRGYVPALNRGDEC